jgi:hypothetical protein
MWKEVIGKLEEQGKVGSSLPLKCVNHPEDRIAVNEPHDFERLAGDGGCSLPCGTQLPCGHVCQRRSVLQFHMITDT